MAHGGSNPPFRTIFEKDQQMLVFSRFGGKKLTDRSTNSRRIPKGTRPGTGGCVCQNVRAEPWV